MSRFAVYLRLYILILRPLRDLNIVYEKKKLVFSIVKDLKVSTFIEHCKETQNTHHTVITAPLWGTKTLTVDLDHFLIVHRRKLTDVVRRENGLFLNMMPQPRKASRFSQNRLLLLYLEAAWNQPHHTASKPLSPNLLIPPASHMLALQPHHTSTNSAAWSSM